mgnify:FL=1
MSKEKIENLLKESCIGYDVPYEKLKKDIIVKDNSVYFSCGWYDNFWKKYHGCIFSIVGYKGIGIHRWGQHIGSNYKDTLKSITFKKEDCSITIVSDRNGEEIVSSGTFKPDVFKELYETAPNFIKEHNDKKLLCFTEEVDEKGNLVLNFK